MATGWGPRRWASSAGLGTPCRVGPGERLLHRRAALGRQPHDHPQRLVARRQHQVAADFLEILERIRDARRAGLLAQRVPVQGLRSEEHTSELQSLMRISYAVFCLKKKKPTKRTVTNYQHQIPTPITQLAIT